MNVTALRRRNIVIAADRSGEFRAKPRPFVLLQTLLLPDEAAPLPVVAITTTFRDAPLLASHCRRTARPG